MVDNDEAVESSFVIGSSDDAFVMQEGVVGSTRGRVTGKGEARNVGVLGEDG